MLDQARSIYEDDDVIARITNSEAQLDGEFETYFSEVYENFNYVAGQIYSGADIAKIHKENRPAFVKNIFKPILKYIVGNFKESLPGVDILARTPSDAHMAKIIQDVNDWILHDKNDISYELAEAFLYAAIGRMSWLKQDYSFREDPLGCPDASNYDLFRIKYDTYNFKRDLRYTQFLSDAGWYSYEELISIYARNNPDLSQEIRDKAVSLIGESTKKRNWVANWFERVIGRIRDYSGEATGYDVDGYPDRIKGDWFTDNGRFKAVDWYERRRDPQLSLFSPMTGQVDITELIKYDDESKRGQRGQSDRWYDNDKLQMVRQQVPDAIISEDFKPCIYQISVIPAMNIKVYEGKQQLQNNNYKFTPVLYENFHPEIFKTKSVVDDIKGSVKSYNLRDNTILTILMKVAREGWIAEDWAVEGYEDDYSQNVIGGMKRVKKGALSQGAIQPLNIDHYPSGLEKYKQEDLEDTKYLSGATDNTRGMQESKNESGKLFNSRVAQAELLQLWSSDNGTYPLKMISENNLFYIQKVMNQERIIRLNRDEGDPYYLALNQRSLGQIQNDTSIGEYDIRISRTPYGRLGKEIEFEKIMQVAQFVGKLNPMYIPVDELIKSSPILNKEAWLKRIEMVEGITQQQQQMEQVNSELGVIQNMQSAKQTNLQNEQTESEMDIDNSIRKAIGV